MVPKPSKVSPSASPLLLFAIGVAIVASWRCLLLDAWCKPSPMQMSGHRKFHAQPKVSPGTTRRKYLLGSFLVLGPAVTTFDSEAQGATIGLREDTRRTLLELIPTMGFGAPATNLTLPASIAKRIEEVAADLEELTPYPKDLAFNQKSLQLLNGSWRLLYSNAPEITNLASLPLGFQLGEVYQPIDVPRQYLENQGAITHSLGIASGSTRVIARFNPALAGTANSVGVVNVAGNRLGVNFDRVAFSLDRFFVFTSTFRKILVPTPSKGAADPAIDVTYLDDTLRVTRGGDGALFILRREESPTPLLSPDEVQELELETTDSKRFDAAKDSLVDVPELGSWASGRGPVRWSAAA